MSNLRDRTTATFKHPDTGEPLQCQILDRVWIKEPQSFARFAPKKGSYGWRQAAFVVQLIDWDGHKKVRFTYYLRRPGTGNFYFGGQFSPVMSIREYRAMMKKLSRKKW